MECPPDNIGQSFLRYTRYPYLKPSAQQQGVPPPPVQKPPAQDRPLVELPDVREAAPQDVSLLQAIEERRSIRRFSPQPLSLAELSLLLWTTQGVKESGAYYTLRTVPSAGARHAFETYLAVFNVAGLKPALYRYLPLNHQLVLEKEDAQLAAQLVRAAHGQVFCGRCAVTFIWSAVVERMTWRYCERGYRYLYLDAGHLCQNLYLACRLVDAGCCAIAAFDDEVTDHLVGVDGAAEFVIYLAPVGKL